MLENPIARESYNHFIECRVVPNIKIFDRQTIPVFPLAHCGSYGTINRNAASGRCSDDLQKQKEAHLNIGLPTGAHLT